MNESPLDKLIRELREENEKLKRSLDGGTVMEVVVGIDAKGTLVFYGCLPVPLI